MIIIIRFKGGPGSGHHGHRGRPGLRGGSLPGKCWGVVGSTKIMVVGNVSQSAVAHVAEWVSALPEWAKKGVAEVRLYEERGAEFKVGEHTYNTGGEWDRRTSTISIYSANLYMTYDVGTILSHEVGHSICDRWVKVGHEQLIRAYHEHANWFDVRQLRVKPECEGMYRLRYPLAASWEDFKYAWDNGQDGITPYSKAWAKSGKYSETIAEMASIYFTEGRKALVEHSVQHGAEGLAQAFLDAAGAMERHHD